MLQAHIISQTVCHCPGKRPTASELLTILDSEGRYSNAKIIAEKDETICRLLNEAKLREKEIAELRRQISELSLPPSPSQLLFLVLSNVNKIKYLGSLQVDDTADVFNIF